MLQEHQAGRLIDAEQYCFGRFLLQGSAGHAVSHPLHGGRPAGSKPGCTRLVQTLAQHDLVDEFRLMIDPVVVGGGKRVFPDDGVLRPLRLAASTMTTTGAILATYAPASG